MMKNDAYKASGEIWTVGWDIPTKWAISHEGECFKNDAHGGKLELCTPESLLGECVDEYERNEIRSLLNIPIPVVTVLTGDQKKALTAWCQWYSTRLGRMNFAAEKGIKRTEDYTGYEQDLFESFGCSEEPFDD